jgi:hypothetical protein
MEIILNIEISDSEIILLKSFKEHERKIFNEYHSIAWELEYKGILLSTTLNEQGKETNNRYFLLSGLGKEIIKEII